MNINILIAQLRPQKGDFSANIARLGQVFAQLDTLAAQPDVLEKIRDGKVQAAGAVIGAVMKAMQGQADAARVRELVLERATSTQA